MALGDENTRVPHNKAEAANHYDNTGDSPNTPSLHSTPKSVGENTPISPIGDITDSQLAPTQVFPDTPKRTPRILPKTPVQMAQEKLQTFHSQISKIEQQVSHIPEILAFMEKQNNMLEKVKEDLKLSQKVISLQSRLNMAESETKNLKVALKQSVDRNGELKDEINVYEDKLYISKQKIDKLYESNRILGNKVDKFEADIKKE